MTEVQKDEIVDRYTRGQTMSFIRFAMEVPVDRVREVLRERKVKVVRSCQRNRAWGYRGGFDG